MKCNLYFLAVVVATGAITSSLLFADQGGYSGPGNSDQPKTGYAVVEDGSGEHLRNCYKLDADGNLQYQADDSYCHASYAVSEHYCGMGEPNYCVNADANGVTYGKAVDASLCRVRYGFGSQKVNEDSACFLINEGPSCFSKDASGRLFGDPVDPSLCKSK